MDLLRGAGADAVALVDGSGAHVTYAALAARAQAFAQRLGVERKLVLLQASNDVASVSAYLGTLLGGHAAIIIGASDDGLRQRLVEAFAPGVIVEAGEPRFVPGAPTAVLHPDLALLLPTSGSVGSSKLVRLSHQALETNARAIAAYLQIDSSERAITSLPLHYAYGLSVLNSHLVAGASVTLTEAAVADPAFWALFRKAGATSLAGVPHSYEIFERIGLRDDPPATLRVLTQAGGRLEPRLVRLYAEFAAARGGRFYAMYGQTEAAPRMAYLPPELAVAHADCIGVAVPGGQLSLIDARGREIRRSGASGELVYRGPNVMMGYAQTREDLALGATLDRLRTGDRAVRTPAGLYRIVGRTSRFLKIVGRRIGLDDLERRLAEQGLRAYAGGSDDTGLAILLAGAEEGDVARVREVVARACKLPVTAVTVYAAAEPPTLASGKIDYRTIGAEAQRRRAPVSRAEGRETIAAAYAEAMGIPEPDADATFASLGGDSLSYVRASIGIERVLGQLPQDWETLSIAQLQSMAAPEAPAPAAWRALDSEVLVRAAAILMIIGGHAMGREGKMMVGGSGVLMAMSGYSLARFQGAALKEGRILPAISSSIYRLVLPYLVCLTVAFALWPHDPSLAPSGFWLGNVVTARHITPLGGFWMIEALFQALLVTCALFLVPRVRTIAQSQPFALMMGLAAAAAAWMWIAKGATPRVTMMRFSLDAWLYLYYLGWAAFAARGPWRKFAVVAAAALISGLQYTAPSYREGWLTLSLAFILFAPRLTLPAPIVRVAMQFAAASYFIFLAQVFVHQLLYQYGAGLHSGLLRLGIMWSVSTGLGLVFARAWSSVAPPIWLAVKSWGVRQYLAWRAA